MGHFHKMPHLSNDLRAAAVRYYLNHKSFRKTATIFGCSKSSLARWLAKHNSKQPYTSKRKSSLSYKVTKTHIVQILKLIEKDPTLTNLEICRRLNLDITQQHLGRILMNSIRQWKKLLVE